MTTEKIYTATEASIHWTRWDWQPCKTSVSDISDAEFLQCKGYRLDIFCFRGLWHWSVVCPWGHSLAGICCRSKEDARDEASKAAEDHYNNTHA